MTQVWSISPSYILFWLMSLSQRQRLEGSTLHFTEGDRKLSETFKMPASQKLFSILRGLEIIRDMRGLVFLGLKSLPNICQWV